MSAVKKGAEVLELDVVVSRDKKVVVSHEFVMLAFICLALQETASLKRARISIICIRWIKIVSNSMTVDPAEIEGFQIKKKQKADKPLLREVVDTVENFIQANNFGQY